MISIQKTNNCQSGVNNMTVSTELLYFFYLAISSGLIEYDDYIEKLNGLFLADEEKSDILLELEYCT